MNQAFSKILIAIVLLVFLAGGILAWQYFGVPREEAMAPVDETADWKTYSGVGFTIKYPKDWKVAIEEVINLTYLTPEEIRVPEDIWIYATVSKKENLQAQPFYNPINFFGKPQPSPEKVKINDKEFYKSEEKFEAIRDIKYAIANADESKIGWITLSIRQGRQRMDYYLPDNEIAPELRIFNLMLSTFEFIEEDETADWKTYRNEEYGYEVKYPKDWKLWITQPDEFSPQGDWGKQIGELAIFQSRVIGTPYCEFHLTIYSNPKSLSIGDFWRARLSEVYTFKSSDNIVFGKNQISGVKFLMERTDQPLPNESMVTITKKNSNIIELFWWGRDPSISNPDCLKVDQMLSTFRFLE